MISIPPPLGKPGGGGPLLGERRSGDLEALRVGVAIFDKDRVEPGDARPPLDRGDDRLVIADLGPACDPPPEQAADDTLMDEFVARLELAPRRLLGHARRSARAAGGAVDGVITIEHSVPRMGIRMTRLACPHDVAEAANGRVFRMHELIALVEHLP